MGNKLMISLKAARVNAKIEAAEAATHIGVDKRTIFNWESGKTVPDHDVALKLASLYGIDIEHIFFGPNIAKSESED